MAAKEKTPTKGSLKDRILGSSTISLTAALDESKIFDKSTQYRTRIPMVNVALSASVDGGFSSGLSVIAGPSKHFKSLFAMLMIEAFLRAEPDGVVIFYDSEFGSPSAYFKAFNIDMSRVIHSPITDIEMLKHDFMVQLNSFSRTDKVMIVVDSVGNLASKKEVEDALSGKSVADMTRAKALKSLFRMVTPHLTIKDIPCFVVNHTYQTQEMFSKTVVSGGCVVEGTKIQLYDGSLEEIQNLQPGQLVKTTVGPKVITANWTPDTLEFGTPECYEIEFEDGYIVTVSNHHPFLVSGEWIDAEDLNVGDLVETT